MIELTVGLPMYRSKLTARVAFESLVNQKNIDFDWELLIIEENEEQKFGSDGIKQFTEGLKAVRCKRIEYISLERWIHLSFKWRILAKESSETSRCFLLKAADCYSQPHRLKETYDIFKSNPEIGWVQSQKGYFYQLELRKMSVFNHGSPGYHHPCALNMAIRTDLLKSIVPNVSNSVDRDLYTAACAANGGTIKMAWNHSENWKLGVDLDGISNFSRDRKLLIERGARPFENTDATLREVVPDITNKFIQSLEKHAATHTYII